MYLLQEVVYIMAFVSFIQVALIICESEGHFQYTVKHAGS